MGILLPRIDFPNRRTLPGGLLEFPLLRSPRGGGGREICGVITDLKVDPDRVVLRLDGEGQEPSWG